MEKLKCGPVVQMRCDDMMCVIRDQVRERFVEPYLDAHLRVFDLSIEHPVQTNDTVTVEAAQALNMHNKGAANTAENDVLEKYHLERIWITPNAAAIRKALGGAVFREPIVCCNIPPVVKQRRKLIVIARHAFGDQYNGQDFVAPGAGTLQIKYSPTIGAPYNLYAQLPACAQDFADWLGAQHPKEECLELQATPRIYQATKSDREREIAAVKKERDDLTAILSSQQNTKSAAMNNVAEQRRKRIPELDDSFNQLHKTVNEQSPMIGLKEGAERSAKKPQQVVSNMKEARVQLLKRMKEESERHRRPQTERIREVRVLQVGEQQQLAQVARKERQNALRISVLQWRVDDALAAKNRLEAAERCRLENRAYGNGFHSMVSRVKCEMSKLQKECNNLKEDLSKAPTEKCDIRTRLDCVECEVGELRCELGTKTHELDALVSFYSNREKRVQRSPQALPQSSHVSCYTELRMVEQQEANAMLQQQSCRLQSEQEETTARSASDRDKVASQGKELEDGHARLNQDNQALEDRIGDLEVKLNNQLELQRKSEEDELTAEALEERLQAELEELQNQCEGCKTSASDMGQLTAEKERLELKPASEHSEIQILIAERGELCHMVHVLEKENEGLKCNFKPANEECAKNIRATFASINFQMNKNSAEMKKSNFALREEAAIWKEKCLNQQSLRERREALSPPLSVASSWVDDSQFHPMAIGCTGSLARHRYSVGRLRLHLAPAITAEDERVLQVALAATLTL